MRVYAAHNVGPVQGPLVRVGSNLTYGKALARAIDLLDEGIKHVEIRDRLKNGHERLIRLMTPTEDIRPTHSLNL